MNIFLSSFESVAVLFVVGTIGVWALKRQVLPENSIRVLSIIAIEIALPCHIFYTIVTRFDPAQNHGWWKFPVLWVVFTGAAGVAALGAGPVFSKKNRRECCMALFYQNAVFVPLILITQLFEPGTARLVDLFLFTMLFPAFFFSTHRLFFTQQPGHLRWQRIFPPALIATALAVSFSFLSKDQLVPEFLLAGLRMVGLMATPALLLLLGGSIYLDFRQRGPFAWKDVLVFAGIKNFLFPVLAMTALVPLNPSPEVSFLILLQSAVPPLTALPVVAGRAGANKRIVNQLMFASFLLTPLSLPLALHAGSRLLDWQGIGL
jgi:predicted permease